MRKDPGPGRRTFMTQPSQPSDPRRTTGAQRPAQDVPRSGRRPRPVVVVGVLLVVVLVLALGAFFGMRAYLDAGADVGAGADEPAVAAVVDPSPVTPAVGLPAL